MAHRDWPIIGHTEAIEFFEGLLAYEARQSGKIGGTYILNGVANVGKAALLETFISRLLAGEQLQAQAPTFFSDIVRLERTLEKREIGVEQVREFSARLALSSYAGPYRIGIISEAETLSLEAANALLKTLEDAREQVLIFLLTSATGHLPATVVSRSQVVRFSQVPTDSIYEWLIEKHGVARPQAKNIARLAGGRPGIALQLAKDPKFLEETLTPAKSLYAALCAPLHERWQLAGALVGKGKLAAEAVAAIIARWQVAIRDIMLVRLNQPDLIMHAFLDKEIRLAAERITLGDLRSLERTCVTAQRYIRANVSPKLVLEQAIMNML